MSCYSFVIAHLFATGSNPERHQIIHIGGTRYSEGKPPVAKDWLLKPRQEITRRLYLKTGFSQEQYSAAKHTWEHDRQKITAWLGNADALVLCDFENQRGWFRDKVFGGKPPRLVDLLELLHFFLPESEAVYTEESMASLAQPKNSFKDSKLKRVLRGMQRHMQKVIQRVLEPAQHSTTDKNQMVFALLSEALKATDPPENFQAFLDLVRCVHLVRWGDDLFEMYKDPNVEIRGAITRKSIRSEMMLGTEPLGENHAKLWNTLIIQSGRISKEDARHMVRWQKDKNDSEDDDWRGAIKNPNIEYDSANDEWLYKGIRFRLLPYAVFEEDITPEDKDNLLNIKKLEDLVPFLKDVIKEIKKKRDRKFSTRPSQEEYVQKLEEILRQQGFSIIEAGTGVGKTLGYLLPVIKYPMSNHNRQVIIATGTKNLRSQILEKDWAQIADLKIIKGHMNLHGRRHPIQISELRGKDDYLCISGVSAIHGSRKYREGGAQTRLAWLHLFLVVRYAQGFWSKSNILNRKLPGLQNLALDASAAEVCFSEACAIANDRCVYPQAVKRAHASDIILTTHHKLGHMIRPNDAGQLSSIANSTVDICVIDEADRFGDNLRSALTWRITWREVARLHRSLVGFQNRRGFVKILEEDIEK